MINRNAKLVLLPFLVLMIIPDLLMARMTQYPREDRLKVDVYVQETMESEEGVFRYGFGVANAMNSKQKIGGFALEMPVGPEEGIGKGAVRLPDGWAILGNPIRKTKLYSFDRDWERGGLVEPGKSTDGLKFTSEAAPGIINFRAWGYVPLSEMPTTADLPPETPYEAPDLTGSDYVSNSFKGRTVGPQEVLDGKSPQYLIERLVAQQTEATSLGWITPRAVSDGLSCRLREAQEKICRSDEKAAIGVLNGLLGELDGLRGRKSLNDNAYFLLKVNVEYLIQELEKPWYKKWFGKHHHHEHEKDRDGRSEGGKDHK